MWYDNIVILISQTTIMMAVWEAAAFSIRRFKRNARYAFKSRLNSNLNADFVG